MTRHEPLSSHHPLRAAFIVLLALGMALSMALAGAGTAEARGGPPDHAGGPPDHAGAPSERGPGDRASGPPEHAPQQAHDGWARAQENRAAARDRARCPGQDSLSAEDLSIQLWTFHSAIGEIGVEAVLEGLADIGYRYVEPYGGAFAEHSMEEFAELLDEYGLSVVTRHMSTNEANWDANLEDAALFGQVQVGSGGFASPGIDSYEDTLATAETMNRLGERSVEFGTGPIYGHNHAVEFTTTYVDEEGDGTEKSAWQIIVENTDPEYVTFQLDVGWANRAGEDSVALLEEFGDRITSLHLKDYVVDEDGNWTSWVPVGDGVMDFEAILAAADNIIPGGYIVEEDFPDDAFETAQRSWDYLMGLCY